MSCWQFVPLDILTSLLPYFDFDTPEEIEAFTADPYIHFRLCEDSSAKTYFWRYLFTRKLSEELPKIPEISLKERYIKYLTVKRDLKVKELEEKERNVSSPIRNEIYSLIFSLYLMEFLRFAGESGYELLFQNLIELYINQIKPGKVLPWASQYGFITTVQYLNKYIQIFKIRVDPLVYIDSMALAVKYGHLDVVKFLMERDELRTRTIIELMLELATRHDRDDIAEYLRNLLADIDS